MEPLSPKEELLASVRAALRRSGRSMPAGEAGPGPGPAPAGERAALFRRKLEEAGGTSLAGPSIETVLPALAETLRLAGVSSLFFPDDDPGARSLAEALAPYGPFLIVPPGEVRQPLPPVTAGIQTAEFAVAETGTIVQTSRGGKTLLPGLIPDVHVALVPPQGVVGAMEECLEALCADPPRNISLITGPSRTADIELTLTIGVHGPGRVIALLAPQA